MPCRRADNGAVVWSGGGTAATPAGNSRNTTPPAADTGTKRRRARTVPVGPGMAGAPNPCPGSRGGSAVPGPVLDGSREAIPMTSRHRTRSGFARPRVRSARVRSACRVLLVVALAGIATAVTSTPAPCAETVRCPEPNTVATRTVGPADGLHRLWTYGRTALLAARGDYAGALSAGAAMDRCR